LNPELSQDKLIHEIQQFLPTARLATDKDVYDF
jgi:hypothetical protein